MPYFTRRVHILPVGSGRPRLPHFVRAEYTIYSEGDNMGDKSETGEIWDQMVELHAKLKKARDEQRQNQGNPNQIELGRRLSVSLTELEKALSYYHTMVLEGFGV